MTALEYACPLMSHPQTLPLRNTVGTAENLRRLAKTERFPSQ